MKRGVLVQTVLAGLLLGGCGDSVRGQPPAVVIQTIQQDAAPAEAEATEIGYGQGPRWFGAQGEPVDVLRWQMPVVQCGYTHAATQLWVAPWDYGEIDLPAGSFNILGPPYESGRPPTHAESTPLWSAAGRLWVLPGDENVLFLVRKDEYEILRRPSPADPNGGCFME